MPGILYHLDAQDVIELVHRMSGVCTRCLVIDTHISDRDDVAFSHDGRTYWGRNYTEHAPGSSAAAKQESLWASIDNDTSFWPTRASLLNVLAHAGFTSAYKCRKPTGDRKAHRSHYSSCDQRETTGIGLVTDRVRRACRRLARAWATVPRSSITAAMSRLAGDYLPAPVKRTIKWVLR